MKRVSGYAVLVTVLVICSFVQARSADYAVSGVAEIIPWPASDSPWSITPAGGGTTIDTISLPVDGWMRWHEQRSSGILDASLSIAGPAMNLNMSGVVLNLEDLQIALHGSEAGEIKYGSLLGPQYGRQVFELSPAVLVSSGTNSWILEADMLRHPVWDRHWQGGRGERGGLGTIRFHLQGTDHPAGKPSGGHGFSGNQLMCPGGGPCGVIGADVVPIDVGAGLQQYGTVDGITGYSMSVTECNIGDEWAAFFSNTNQHPVIGQNLYRITQGRFEQIGMSWLFHTWVASDFFECGPGGTPNGNGSWMAIGIADVDSAGLMGAQSDLGPRSEVNASDGVFPYPYELHWNETGDAIFKRLQVHVSDLDDSDGQDGVATYLAELHMMAPDELPNDTDTQYNNASWRQVVRGEFSNGYFLSFVDSAHEQESAIEAWPQFDPDVKLEEVLVAEDGAPDGRITVGYNVQNIGDGDWSYDYAVYNYNSHRSVGSVSIEASQSETMLDVGFHDVDYHSGEPIDGTDWPGVVNGGLVTWATTPFEENENANAIRWGTTYSFHFVSSGPPDRAELLLGMFRPGAGPDSITVVVVGPATDCDGNEIADAIDIADGTHMDVDENGIPDICQAVVAVVAAMGSKNITATLTGGGGDPFAIHVTGDVADPDVACVDVFLQSDGSLGPAAAFRTLEQWGPAVHINGPQIIPSATYTVSFENDSSFSQVATTWLWADADNNGTTNLGDAFLAVLGFQGNFLIPLEVLDIEPCDPNGEISLADVFWTVLAFQGQPYAELCQTPCP